MIITIDGPVAGGKSTAARNLARALGFDYLDSGAVYRAITLLARRTGIDTSNRGAVKTLLAQTRVRLEGEKTFLNGEDVSNEIRLPEVSSAVKPLAENPDVRDFVKAFERRITAGRNMVADGRDMGTVVFPEAPVKIYLTASAEERARRRWQELKQRGTPQAYEEVLAELTARDKADMTRAIAPLRKAADAIEFDSTGLEPEETARGLEKIVRGKLRGL